MGDWFSEGGSGSPIDVVAMLDSETGKLLHGIINIGALVSCGLTSDGGALGVTITVDGAWRREYFRQGLELEAWLLDGWDPIEAAVQQARAHRASSGQRRSRRAL